MAGTVEERRAIIATLVRRGDADAVALLRWALGASDPDLAVDAALALEEMTASFDARLAACRDALAAARGGRGESAAPRHDAGVGGRARGRRADHPRDRRRRRRSRAGAGPRRPKRAKITSSRGADTTLADAVAIGRTQLELGALRPDTALASSTPLCPGVGPRESRRLLSLPRGGAARVARAALGRAVGARHLPGAAFARAPPAADRAQAAGPAAAAGERLDPGRPGPDPGRRRRERCAVSAADDAALASFGIADDPQIAPPPTSACWSRGRTRTSRAASRPGFTTSSAGTPS